MKKRLISLLLALVMCLGMLPLEAAATEDAAQEAILMAEEPVAEELIAEEPAAEEPAAEEPAAEEPAAEEPAAEEPAAEEPAVEEPAAEEPAAEEPAVEEPAAEEPAVEEPAAEEPAAEEPAAEEPAAEEPVAEEPAAEVEPAAEEPVLDAAAEEGYEEEGDDYSYLDISSISAAPLTLGDDAAAAITAAGGRAYFSFTPESGASYSFCYEGTYSASCWVYYADGSLYGQYELDYGSFSAWQDAGETRYFAVRFGSPEDVGDFTVRIVPEYNDFWVWTDSDWYWINPGEEAELSVYVSGVDLSRVTYSWQAYDPFAGVWSDIPGAESAALAVPCPDVPTEYRCMAMDRYGNTASVTIRAARENHFTAGIDGEGSTYGWYSVPPHTDITLRAAASADEGEIRYRWSAYEKYCPDPEYPDWYEWDWFDLEEEVTDTVTVTDVTEDLEYQCVVTDDFGGEITLQFHIEADNELVVWPEGAAYSDWAEQYEDTAYLSAAPGGELVLRVNYTAHDTDGLTFAWYEEYTVEEEENSWKEWRQIEDADGDTFTVAVNGLQRYYCRVSDGYDSSAQAWFNVTVDSGFRAGYVGDENGNLLLHPNDAPVLRVSASADLGEVHYQWYGERVDEWGWSEEYPIEGAAESSYAPGPVTAGTEYRCHVSDDYGNSSDLKFWITVDNELAVWPEGAEYFEEEGYYDGTAYLSAAPGGTLELKTNYTACDTDGLTFAWYEEHTVEEDGYSWTDWRQIEGADGDTLTVTVNGRRHYYCSVSDSYGNSINAWFDVKVDSGFHAERGGDGRDSYGVLPGETQELSVAASVNIGEVHYQWYGSQLNEWGGYDYAPIEGAAESSYTVGPVTSAADYYCSVSDDYGNGENLWFSIYVDNGLTAWPEGAAYYGDEGYHSDTVELYAGLGAQQELRVVWDAYDREGVTLAWYEGVTVEEDGYSWMDWQQVAADVDSITVTVDTFRQYRCRVSDPYASSVDALFNVYVDSGFRAEHGEGRNSYGVLPGETQELSVVASVNIGEVHYQWYGRQSNEWSYAPIEGETGNRYTAGPIDGSAEYYCRVSDDYGNSSELTFWVYVDNGLTVWPEGAAYNEDEGYYSDTVELYAELGAEQELKVNWDAYDREGVTLAWYEGVTVEDEDYSWTDWQRIEGAGGDTLTVTVNAFSQYRCTVTDRYYGEAAALFNVHVENGFRAEYGGDGRDSYRVRPGETQELSVAASANVGDVHYQWYERQPDQWGWYDYAPIEGETESSYTAGPVTSAAEYCCRVSDDYGNSSDLSFWVYVDNGLTVWPEGAAYNEEEGRHYNTVRLYPEEDEQIELKVRYSALDETDITFAWYELIQDSDDSWHEERIEDAAGDAITVTAGSGEEYYCEVTDRYGNYARAWFELYADEAFVDYDREWDRSVLPGWDGTVNGRYGGHLENAEHPEGWDFEYSVTDVRVLTGEEHLEEFHYDEDGDNYWWYYRAGDYGEVEFEVFYEDVYGEEQSYTFRLYVNEDVYGVDLRTSDGTDTTLPGGTIDLYAEAWHWSTDEERDGDVSGVTYEWSLPYGAENDIAALRVDENDPQHAVLTFREYEEYEEGRWYNVCVRVTICGEDGGPLEQNERWLHVSSWYTELLPAEIADLEPGESITVNPEVRQYGENLPEGYETEQEVHYRWYYDANAVEIRDAEGVLVGNEDENGDYIDSAGSYGMSPAFTITRLMPWETDIGLWAEWENGHGDQDGIDRRYRLSNRNPEIWFDWYDGRTLYSDGELALGLDTQDIPEEAELRVRTGRGFWDDGAREWIWEEEFDSAWASCAYDDEQGRYVVKLDGGAIWAHENAQAQGGGNDDYRCAVMIEAVLNGYVLTSRWEDCDVREAIVDYDREREWDRPALPGWDGEVRMTYRAWVEDSLHPYGEWVDYTVLDVELTEQEPWVQSEPVIETFEKKEYEDGSWSWYFRVGGYGRAVFTVTHQDIYDPAVTRTYDFTVFVEEDVYFVHTVTRDGSNIAMPGGVIDLYALTSHYSADAGEVDTDNVTYAWSIEGDDDHMADITWAPDDPHATVSFRADGEWQWYDVDVRVTVFEGEDDAGQPVPRADWITNLHMSSRYAELCLADFDGTVDWDEAVAIRPEVRWYPADTETGYELMEAEFRLYYDANILEIRDEDGIPVGNFSETEGEWIYNGSEASTGTSPVFTVTRVGDGGTELHIDAIWSVEGGEEQSFHSAYFVNMSCEGEGAEHRWIHDVIAEPGCTEAGEELLVCRRCGEKRHVPIPALGHDWGEWTVTRPATVDEEGEETRVCRHDPSHKETRPIPKLEPAYPILTEAFNSATGVRVSWLPVEGAVKYRLLRKNVTKGETTWSVVGETTSMTDGKWSIIDKSVASASRYTFTVEAVDAAGSVSPRDETGRTCTYISLANITELKAVEGGVSLTWSKPAGARNFRVMRRNDGETKWTTIAVVEGTSYIDTAAPKGGKIWYTVRGVSMDNTVLINSYNGTGWSITPVDAPVLTEAFNSSTGVRVSWKAVDGAAKYRLLRKNITKNESEWTEIAVTTDLTYIDKSAVSASRYTYTVECVDAVGRTSSAQGASRTCTYIAMAKITTIGNVTAGIKLAWSKPAGAQNFRVMRKGPGDTKWTVIAVVKGTSYIDTTAQKGVTYRYTVRGVSLDNTVLINSYNDTGWTVKRQ